MQVEMLQSIVGTGDDVEGFRRDYSLEVGMVVNVDDSLGRKWSKAGICRIVEPADADAKPLEETTLSTPEQATLKRPKPRARKGRNA